MTKSTDKEPKPDICEICNEPLKKGEPWLGCEQCGRMYGPCCNSDQDSYCVECSQ